MSKVPVSKCCKRHLKWIWTCHNFMALLKLLKCKVGAIFLSSCLYISLRSFDRKKWPCSKNDSLINILNTNIWNTLLLLLSNTFDILVLSLFGSFTFSLLNSSFFTLQYSNFTFLCAFRPSTKFQICEYSRTKGDT